MSPVVGKSRAKHTVRKNSNSMLDGDDGPGGEICTAAAQPTPRGLSRPQRLSKTSNFTQAVPPTPAAASTMPSNSNEITANTAVNSTTAAGMDADAPDVFEFPDAANVPIDGTQNSSAALDSSSPLSDTKCVAYGLPKVCECSALHANFGRFHYPQAAFNDQRRALRRTWLSTRLRLVILQTPAG